MPRTLLIALLLLPAIAIHAQTPTGVSVWPQPTAIKPGTHLLLGLHSDSHNTVPCRLQNLDPDHVVCAGHHHSSTAYDRADVDTIQRVRLPFPKGLLFKEGILVALLGFFCAVDGGPICLTPVAIGLSMMAGSVVLYFIEAAHHNRNLFFYIAPYEPTP
jgi:hypothetical protein